MSDSPLVSVAMATFNGERFLHEQLDTILAQTYTDFEIVVSDDASVDRTASILHEYALKDSRIKVLLNKDRLGYVGNFQRALVSCAGETIFLADQDDIWMNKKIETLLFFLGSGLLVHSDAELVDSEGESLAPSFNTLKKSYCGTDAFGALLNGNFITGCTIAFKKDLLAQAIPFPRNIPHDYWLALVAATTGGVRGYPGVLTKYRQHSSNVFGAGFKKSNVGKNYSRAEKIEAKLAQSGTRIRSICDIVESLGERLRPQHQKLAKKLMEYYSSYCTKVIRFRAFFFFCVHHKKVFLVMKCRNSVIKALSSLVGNKLERFITWLTFKQSRRERI
ncbi:MAG TPA: glycosyltransferase family 2 protein [bacterium]|nr:glycosyltransferase family 2 protein [bacterium]